MGSAGCVRLTCSAVRKANTAKARRTGANFSAVTASATGDSTETSAACCAKPECADGECCIAIARVGRRPSPRLVGETSAISSRRGRASDVLPGPIALSGKGILRAQGADSEARNGWLISGRNHDNL